MAQFPTLKQIRYFVAVAETRHFRRAAEKMGVSQPSLSLQIANLEDVLGTQLLERGRGPVTLTPAGREVLASAHRALDEIRALVDRASSLGRDLSGTIRLGASPSLGPYLLPRVVEHLHRNFPGLRLYIREGAPRNLRDELLAGTHDLILTQLPVQGEDLETTRLFREALLLAMPGDHPVALKGVATTEDLKGLQMLSLGPEYILHDQVAAICNDYGAELLRDYEGTSLDALRQMVGMGMGAALLPQLYVASEIRQGDGSVVTLPIRRPAFSRSIGLVWRRASGAAATFERLRAEILTVAKSQFASLLTIDG